MSESPRSHSSGVGTMTQEYTRPSSPSQSSHSVSISHSTSSSSLSIRPTAPALVGSPEPTYKSGSTPHYRDYPRSLRERQEMELDIADQAAAERENVQRPTSTVQNYAEVDGRSASEIQQQMLNDSLTGGTHMHLHPITTDTTRASSGGHHSLEIDDGEEPEFVHKFPWRSALVAGFLLCTGITCLLIGLIHLITGSGGAIFAFVLIGGILIIPGAYQTYVIYNAWRRVPGFSFAQLSVYEGR